MSRSCSPGMLRLLFLIYLFFYLFFLFPNLLEFFLAAPKGHQQSRVQPLGLQWGQFLICSLHGQQSTWETHVVQGPWQREKG